MSDRALGVIQSLSSARQTESPPAQQRQLRTRGADHAWIAGSVWPGARRSGWPPHAGRQGIGAWVLAAWRRYRSRQQIAGLDARALRDIGVSYAEAENEANKAFWRR